MIAPSTPVGTKVILTDDSWRDHETRTRSVPWSLCGVLVVLVDGRSGGFSCERLRLPGTPQPERPKKLSRRKLRAKETYEQYLSADSGLPFIEWLQQMRAHRFGGGE